MHNELLEDIGEKELIKRLGKFMPINQASDDCALVKIKKNKLLVNSDALVENVHFTEDTISALDIGWKAIVSNISDLISSGSKKNIGVTVSLILPAKTEWIWIEDLYRGMHQALEKYGGLIIGGDCSLGNEKVIAVTAFGLQGEIEFRRSACKPGEIILTSGIHGLSKLGLMIRSGTNPNNNFTLSQRLINKSIKEFSRPKLKTNLLKNILKTRSNQKITKIGCTDSSDGLFQALQDLSIASNCKAIVSYKKMPKDKDWPIGNQWDKYYFFGGEDYKLIFSLPKKWAKKFICLDNDINEIGYFTSGEATVEFEEPKYNELLKNKPFTHF